MILIDPNTRQFNVPGAELVFGVESDAGSQRKWFQCPRYVGDNLDLASCFVRMNFRNANGEMDSYLVDDVTIEGDNVKFSWVLSQKAVRYKGQVKFVVCAVGPNQKVEWHTTLGSGMVLEGLEPNAAMVEAETADVVAQLIAMVVQQTAEVEKVGADQVAVVKAAAKTAESDAVAEIEAKGVNVKESIPEDYTSLENTMDGLVRGRAGAIVCEAAGSAITVNDASDMKMQGLRIFGRSTQDGTPTPDAPVEIVSVEPTVGVYGKNLITGFVDSTKTANGVSFTVNADNSITVNGTAIEAALFNMITAYDVTPVLRPGATYTISGATSVAAIQIYEWQDKWVQGVSTSSEKTFTLSEKTKGLLVRYVVNPGMTADNLTVYPMLRLASDVDNTYEPGKAAQTIELAHTLPGIPVTSGGNYTDSDGQQWICDEVDLERGVYVQRVKVLELDGVNIAPYAATQDNGQPYVALYPKDIFNSSVVLSTRYSHPGVNWSNENGKIYCIGASIIINDSRFVNTGTAVGCLAEDAPTIMYRLSIPIETPLSETEIAAYRALHSNYPNTTVLNDAGAHMVVKYAADTKQYIDNKIKEALR